MPCPFFVFFGKMQGKPRKKKKTRILYPHRTPKIPGKEGKNARKNKEFWQGRKTRKSKKTRKGRTGCVKSHYLNRETKTPPF